MTIFTVFFFSLFWLQILNLPALLQNKNTRVGPFPWKRSVLQNPDRERTNQSTGICLRLGLPYNNVISFICLVFAHYASNYSLAGSRPSTDEEIFLPCPLLVIVEVTTHVRVC